MTSSPASRSPSSAAIIPSVAPQVTVTIDAGANDQPGYQRLVFAAIASRNPVAPHVIAYWLMSRAIASAAAALSSAGAGKSGNPWARLIAPAAAARRLMSRMTDSVKVSVLWDRRGIAGPMRAEGGWTAAAGASVRAV